jgi:membrane protein
MRRYTSGVINLEALLARWRGVYLIDLLWRTTERYGRDECGIYATAVAFSLLMSLFPLLFVFVAAFGLLTTLPGLGSWIAQIAADQVPGDTLRRLVENISGVPVVANSVAGFVGLATLTWAASGMFTALRRGLNRAFGVVSPPVFIHARALDLARVAALFLIGLLSIGLTTALGMIQESLGRLVVGRAVWPLWQVADWLIPYATLVLIALLLYALVPNHALRARDLWPAALIAGTGWQLTGVGFSIYVANFAQFQQIYGALAGAVALLIFLQLNATIVLFAAGLAAEAVRDRQRPAT